MPDDASSDFPNYRPKRHATSVEARLLADGEDLTAVLLDVSRDGAKLSVPYPLLAGTAVRLRVGKSDTKALVHWSRKGQAGLRFIDRLDPATLIALEAASGKRDAL